LTVRPTLRSPAKVLGPRAYDAIARILEATRSVFLRRGYGGTTTDEIAKVAGMSKASFYTYFPTKRDVLLTLGANSAEECSLLIKQLGELARPWSDADLLWWVEEYFSLLDRHGSFYLAWTQAAYEDEELRTAGMRRHLAVVRVLGEIVAQGDRATNEALGLAIVSLLERAWSYCQLYGERLDPGAIRREIALMIKAMAEAPHNEETSPRRRRTPRGAT
jgi:TetR/AcrR family transcriptional regulator